MSGVRVARLAPLCFVALAFVPHLALGAPSVRVPEVAAIYAADLKAVSTSAGQNQLCAVAAKGALPAPRCTLIGDIPAWSAAGELFSTRGPSWIAVGKNGEILAAVGCDPSGCGRTPPEASLRDQLRCGANARFWSTLPPEALRCDRDNDCAMLESMCFAVALAKTQLPAYRSLLEHGGAICLPANSGACPPSRDVPRCRKRACTLAPR